MVGKQRQGFPKDRKNRGLQPLALRIFVVWNFIPHHGSRIENPTYKTLNPRFLSFDKHLGF
jgi:hypothetical protein